MLGSKFCYGFTGPKCFWGFRDMGPRDNERKIWAQGDTLSTKVQPTCRRDSDHHVRQSSEGIVRMVATGERLRAISSSK